MLECRKPAVTLSTICTPLLISLSYALAEWTSTHNNPPSGAAVVIETANPLKGQIDQPTRASTTSANLISACSLVGGALAVVTIFSKIRFLQQRADAGGGNGHAVSSEKLAKFMPKHREKISILKVADYGLSILGPYFGALELGGTKAALFSIIALAGGLSGVFRSSGGWRKILGPQKGVMTLLLGWIGWEAYTAGEELHVTMLGYFVLLASTLALPSPFSHATTFSKEPNLQFQLSLVTAPILLVTPITKWLFLGVSGGSTTESSGSLDLVWWVLGVLGISASMVLSNVAKTGNALGGDVGFVAGALGALALQWLLALNAPSGLVGLVDKPILVALAFAGTSENSLHRIQKIANQNNSHEI